MNVDVTKLSERELEIIRLVATGASNKDIARQLFISTNTVKVHLRNIFTKIGATSRTEVAMYAVNSGIVKGPNSDQVLPADNILDSDVSENKSPPKISYIWIVIGIFILVSVSLIIYNVSTMQQSRRSSDDTLLQEGTLPHIRDLAPMPTARYGLATVSFENFIYNIGGMSGQGVSKAVEIYDPMTETWKAGSPKPTAVYEISAAVVGGKIFIPGGRKSSGEPTDVLEIYDPRDDKWTRGSHLPASRSAYGLAVFEGQIFLLGGWDGQNFQDEVYLYNPILDVWNEVAPMPTARGYSNAVVAGGKLIVFGGYDGKRALPVTEIFEPNQLDSGKSPWKTGQSMPEGVYAMGSCNLADIVFTIGGLGNGERKFPGMAYFHQNDEWSGLEGNLSLQIDSFGSTSLGVECFAIGGREDNLPISKNLAYQFIYVVSVPIIIR